MIKVEGLYNIRASGQWEEGFHETLQGDNAKLFRVHFFNHYLDTRIQMIHPINIQVRNVGSITLDKHGDSKQWKIMET